MAENRQEFIDNVLGLRLLDGEQIVAVEFVEPGSKVTLTAEEALCKLCGVTSLSDVGKAGPINASTSFSDDADDHLQLYETLFGRDSLIVALLLADAHPELLKATVVKLAQLQGTETNTYSEEQPGRIIHEYRTDQDPVAQKITAEHKWQWPYYGAIDSTPLFILACRKLEELGMLDWDTRIDRPNGSVAALRDSFALATKWILSNLKKSPLGFMETHVSFPTSIENQTWKDSFDSMHYEDGTLPVGPVSSLEVQAQTYDALVFASEVWKLQGFAELAGSVDEAIALLVKNFTKYYLSDHKTRIAMGVGYVDTEPKPMQILGSNIGHLLNSQLLQAAGAEQGIGWIVEQLMSQDLLAGAGVRSLAASELRYRPGAYHCGNVWLWESSLFASSLHKLGYVNEAKVLASRVQDACETFGGFPEYARGDVVTGFNTMVVDILAADGHKNRIEQPPQQIQAWTVAGYLLLKDLGLIEDTEVKVWVEELPTAA